MKNVPSWSLMAHTATKQFIELDPIFCMPKTTISLLCAYYRPKDGTFDRRTFEMNLKANWLGAF